MKFKQILALVFAVALGYGLGQQGGKLYATTYPTSAGGLTASSTSTFTNKTLNVNATGNVITNIGISELEAFGAKGDVIGFANGTAATGTVTLDSGAAGSVDGITVNSVEIMTGAVNFNSTLTQTATDVATDINTKISIPDYTASSSSAVVTITSVKFGTTVNAFVVTSSVTTIASTDVNMADGANGAAELDTFRGHLLGNLDASSEFIQRGTDAKTTAATARTINETDDDATETFPTAFSATPRIVITQTGAVSERGYVAIRAPGTTTFIWRILGNIGTGSASRTVEYIALGA